MNRATTAAAMAALALLTSTCGRAAAQDEIVTDLMTLYEKRDYFELRSRLDTLPDLSGPQVVLLRAAVAHAFNDPNRSNRHLEELGEDAPGLPDSLRVDAHEIRVQNHIRLYEYGAALEATRELLALPAADSSTRENASNFARALEALADAPPQRVASRAASRIERRPDTRVTVKIGDSTRGYVLDTGANLSTMMRSEADSLGLRVREAGVEVGTSTGSKVEADVTIAPRVEIGEVLLENVVFLVVPDELLTFGSFRIPGIIGFPVLDALGEVEFLRGGVIRIPEEVPTREMRNLALDFLTPLVEVNVLGFDAVCEFDTGANTTTLHLPFFERHRERIEAAGKMDTVRFAGAGGERRIPAWVLEDLRVAFGDTAQTLSRVAAYTESVATAGDEHPADCRLGLDALAGFDGYLLNLRSMSFLPL